MRKNVFGRQFKRDRNERKAFFKSLLSSLVLNDSISTTEARAKAIKQDADKLITKAKKGGLHAYRLVEPRLTPEAVKRLLTSVAPRFEKRNGGYTRIIKTGNRLKDNARLVILEWSEKGIVMSNKVNEKTEIKIKREVKDEKVKTKESAKTKNNKKIKEGKK